MIVTHLPGSTIVLRHDRLQAARQTELIANQAMEAQVCEHSGSIRTLGPNFILKSEAGLRHTAGEPETPKGGVWCLPWPCFLCTGAFMVTLQMTAPRCFLTAASGFQLGCCFYALRDLWGSVQKVEH
eukprot:843643-Pelagomonas_calceolata.AAC.1